MTLSFFLTVLALSTPFPISYGAEEFHPPKSTFFEKLNPYLLFEDRLNLTQAQERFVEMDIFNPWLLKSRGKNSVLSKRLSIETAAYLLLKGPLYFNEFLETVLQ